jgi:hypothetical protein
MFGRFNYSQQMAFTDPLCLRLSLFTVPVPSLLSTSMFITYYTYVRFGIKNYKTFASYVFYLGLSPFKKNCEYVKVFYEFLWYSKQVTEKDI